MDKNGPPAPWEDIIPILTEEGLPEPSTERVRLWDLALTARRVVHRVSRSREPGPGWRILVPPNKIDRAKLELLYFEAENAGQTGRVYRRVSGYNVKGWPLLPFLGLVLFEGLMTRGTALTGLSPEDWKRAGICDSFAVLIKDEWARLATSLTLHAGPDHLISNLVFGGVVMLLLCRRTGIGPGFFLALVSGVLGNYVNCLAYGPGHMSLGSSTAIFGGLGLLGGIGSFTQGEWLYSKKGFLAGGGRFLLPAAAAAGLLAFLGTGNESTDRGAHLFGFLSGLFLGIGGALWVEFFGRPKRRVRMAMGAAAIVLPILSWVSALS